MRITKRITSFFMLLAYAIAIAGVALNLIHFLPFDLVKSAIRLLVLGKDARAVTPDWLNRMAFAHTVIGVVLLATAVTLFVGRRSLTRIALELPAATGSFGRAILKRLRRAVRGEERLHLYVLGGVFLVAIVIRWAFLFEPIRHDEANAFTNFASRSFRKALTYYSVPNNHVLHTGLVRIFFLVLGNEPWVLRLPALASGLLLVPASYLAVRRLYGREAALIATGFVASSPALINYSVNARGYTLLILLFLLILFLATYLQVRENACAWVVFALLSSLGFYTIPIFLYPFGIVWLWLFLSILTGVVGRERVRLLTRWVGAGGLSGFVTLLLYLPIILREGWGPLIGNEYIGPGTWSAVRSSLPRVAAAVWKQWNAGLPSIVALGFAVMALVAMILHWRISACRIPVWAAMVLWLVPVPALQRVVPPQRTWLFLLPVFYGLVSASVVYWGRLLPLRAGQHRHALTALVAIALALILSLNDWSTGSVRNVVEGVFPQSREIILFVKTRVQPGDKIAADFPASGSLRYYWNQLGFPDGYFANMQERADHLLVVAAKVPRQTPESVLAALKMSAADYGVTREVKAFDTATVYEMDRVQ